MKNLRFLRAACARVAMCSAVFASLLLLGGCVQHIKDLNATLDDAFFGAEDVSQTSQHVMTLPYASAYMRINDGQRIFVVLGYAEPNPNNQQLQLKWVSADGGMIVTEHGRVVKTLNLPYGNLIRRDVDVNGLASAPPWQASATWQSQYDWQRLSPQGTNRDHYGYVGQVSLTQLGEEEMVTSTIWQQTLSQWQESVYFPQLDKTLHNRYWVNRDGQVMKSIQYLGPEMTRIEFEILKPFAEVAQ